MSKVTEQVTHYIPILFAGESEHISSSLYQDHRRKWPRFGMVWNHGTSENHAHEETPPPPRSLASNPTIQRPRLPGTEQEENIDQNQLCENCAPTNTPGNGPQSLLRALFLGTVPKLGFATTVTHCKLRRAKAREQRGPLREGRRLEREHRQTETALLWKTDPGTQRHSCLQRLN